MRLYGRIQKFADVLDVKGVGRETLVQMVEAKLVKTPSDLWDIPVSTYSKLEGRGEKHFQKLQDGLKAREEMTVSQFFASLDIEGLGTWDNICRVPGLQTYDEIMGLYELAPMRLKQLLSQAVRVSPEKAQNIVDEIFLKKDDILALRGKVRFKNLGQKLMGKVFVVTGSCTAKSRSEIEKLIKENGGQVGSSVSSKTSFLITDDDASTSTKAKKARELNKPVITSQQFLEML
jgi:DNA ligase (NAD+)